MFDRVKTSADAAQDPFTGLFWGGQLRLDREGRRISFSLGSQPTYPSVHFCRTYQDRMLGTFCQPRDLRRVERREAEQLQQVVAQGDRHHRHNRQVQNRVELQVVSPLLIRGDISTPNGGGYTSDYLYTYHQILNIIWLSQNAFLVTAKKRVQSKQCLLHK